MDCLVLNAVYNCVCIVYVLYVRYFNYPGKYTESMWLPWQIPEMDCTGSNYCLRKWRQQEGDIESLSFMTYSGACTACFCVVVRLSCICTFLNILLPLSLSSGCARFCCCFNSFNPDPILTRIGQELWDLDDNRLKPGEDYVIDLQAGRTLVLTVH